RDRWLWRCRSVGQGRLALRPADAARPVAERWMRIVEHPQKAIRLRQVLRLAQQRQGAFAAAVQCERAQANELDVQPALLELLRELVGTRQRLERTSPGLRGDLAVA